jgi:hypothetical protein
MFSNNKVSPSILAAINTIFNEDMEYVAVHKPSGKVSFVGKTKQDRDGYITKHGSSHEPKKTTPNSKKVGDTWI